MGDSSWMNDAGRHTLPGLAHSFREADGLEFSISKPFGPSILEATLPAEILERMIALTDGILGDDRRTSWGRYLVGQIREEPVIAEEVLREHDVYDYLTRMYAGYVLGCMYCDSDPQYKRDMERLLERGELVNPIKVAIESAWVISQREGEYNPIHNHSQATLASVMYLKVPELLPADPIPDKDPVDGCIDLVEGSDAQLQNATIRIRPQAGRFYIFPAGLLHLVYPFRGAAERRSVSINVTHSF